MTAIIDRSGNNYLGGCVRFFLGDPPKWILFFSFWLSLTTTQPEPKNNKRHTQLVDPHLPVPRPRPLGSCSKHRRWLHPPPPARSAGSGSWQKPPGRCHPSPWPRQAAESPGQGTARGPTGKKQLFSNNVDTPRWWLKDVSPKSQMVVNSSVSKESDYPQDGGCPFGFPLTLLVGIAKNGSEPLYIVTILVGIECWNPSKWNQGLKPAVP